MDVPQQSSLKGPALRWRLGQLLYFQPPCGAFDLHERFVGNLAIETLHKHRGKQKLGMKSDNGTHEIDKRLALAAPTCLAECGAR